MSSVVNPGGAPSIMVRALGFSRVSELVPDEQDLLTIAVGTRAGRALELMRAHDFDQVPVTTVSGQVIGVFSHRSLARSLQHVRPQDGLATSVEDLIEEPRFVRAGQPVGEIVPTIVADHAVLVGDEHRVLAIVTTADLTRYLWRRTRPFVLLQDIELAVRGLMRSCCTPEELEMVVAAALPAEIAAGSVQLEDLALSALLSVLLHGPAFGRYFRLGFGVNRELVRTTLVPVREIRNNVFHFRRDITQNELDTLVEVAAWLRRKIVIRGGA